MSKCLVEKLQNKLNYIFQNPDLAMGALVHPSAGGQQFQRLEFLGDRVLGLVAAHWLYRYFPQEPEGHLAKRFVELVKRDTLLKVYQTLQLHKMMLLDSPPSSAEGRIGADACEAILGAIFLDGGLNAAERVIHQLWQPFFYGADLSLPIDPKSSLQEWLQSHKRPLPSYTLLSQTGPSHQPDFQVQVTLDNGVYYYGYGKSKREAEQKAASQALLALTQTK
jgi:ribonuclease-3